MRCGWSNRRAPAPGALLDEGKRSTDRADCRGFCTTSKDVHKGAKASGTCSKTRVTLGCCTRCSKESPTPMRAGTEQRSAGYGEACCTAPCAAEARGKVEAQSGSARIQCCATTRKVTDPERSRPRRKPEW